MNVFLLLPALVCLAMSNSHFARSRRIIGNRVKGRPATVFFLLVRFER